MAVTATERALLIDGEWVETGEWLEVRSPYSGDVVGRVAKGGAAETRPALDAAARALAEPLPAHKRAEILVKVAGLIGKHHEEVARTISDEAGKPIKTARVEASRAMSTYTFAAVEARKLAGEMIPMESAQAGEGKLGFTVRKPIGIVAAISPFNFPCNLVAHKLAPALAAGCPVVLKPASQTPLSALLLASFEQEAGCRPAGSASSSGPASEIGDVFVEDERVKLITFTGSGDVGWKLQERAPRKRVKLELGNSTPVIVAADANIETTAAKLAANAFAFAGPELHLRAAHLRRAAELRRIREGVRAEGRSAATSAIPHDDETDVGPVIDADARTRIAEWIDGGAVRGCQAAHGRRGRRPDQADRARRGR